MASLADLCWSSAEELFDDLDLDDLFVAQRARLGEAGRNAYPYLLLVFTGKITIAINLDNHWDLALSAPWNAGGRVAGADEAVSGPPRKERIE